jgi:hypothetical protein
MRNDAKTVDGGILLQAVEHVAISPQEAVELVSNYQRQVREKFPALGGAEQQELVARKIISRYTWLATSVGVASGLPGIVPGAGTAVVAGTGFADALLCMKLQVSMCRCLAVAFGYDLNVEDTRHLAMLLATGATLEKFGVQAVTPIASRAGVSLVRQYLRGAALQAIKEAFRKLGIQFTRKALEKAIPFGIGVILGASANLAITRYVGAKATEWFVLDR